MPGTAVLDDVDPRELLDGRNIRTKIELDEDFVESVRENGVVQRIIVVRTQDGRLRIKIGHRRTLAAIRTGRPLVPVEIIGDEATDDAAEIQRRLDQYIENKHRRGLSAGDEVRFVQELLELGVGEEEIRKRSRMPRADLTAAAAAARSKLATAAAGRYDFLNLIQSAAIAEFDDDTEAVKALVASARQGEGHFSHLLQQLRDKRAEQAAYDQARSALEADGITVAAEGPGTQDSWLTILKLTDGEHRDCPGHAAVLRQIWVTEDEPVPAAPGDQDDDGEENADDYDEAEDDEPEDDEPEDDEPAWRPAPRRGSYQWRPVFYCTDPVSYGHAVPSTGAASAGGQAGPGEQSGEAAAAATEERRRVLRYNKAWQSAEAVRRPWLAEFLTRPKPPADAVRFILSAVIRGDYDLRKAMEGGHEGGASLLGIERPAERRWNDYGLPAAFEAAGEDRARVIALGAVLAAYEDHTGVHTWRQRAAEGRRYLAALESWGYDLAPVERYTVDGTEF